MSRQAHPEPFANDGSAPKIPWLRSGLYAGAFFVVGFCLARLLRPVVVEPPSASTTTAAASPMSALGHAPEQLIAPPENRDRPGPGSHRNGVDPQLATLRRRMTTGFYFLGTVFEDGRVRPEVALLFGLSPAELTELETATHRASETLNRLRTARATATVADEGRRIIVSVPSLGAAGSAVYAELLGTFSAMLGPERMKYFDRMAGQSLEWAFDGYGLEAKRFEFVESTKEGSLPAAGVVSLIVTSSDGKTENTSAPTWFSLANLAEEYPFATQFIPPGFGRAGAAP